METAIESSIPTIDLSLPANVVAEKMRTACLEFGFFYLVNHGVSHSLISQVYSQAESFFKLPLQEKLRLKYDKNFRGYFPMMEEVLDPNVQDLGDFKECYHIGRPVSADSEEADLPLHGPNVFPDAKSFPEFESITTEYFSQLKELGHRLTLLFGQAAGAAGLFETPGTFDKPMAVLRLLHYDAKKSDVENGVYGCGAHTDYGLLTLLSTDNNGGLEIEFNGNWIKIPARGPEVFVVNIGDMAERWTNGIFKSTKHRVLNYSGKDRYSLPFFYEPNFNCKVEVLPSCISAERPAQYAPTISGEHLLEKYRQTHTNFKTPSD